MEVKIDDYSMGLINDFSHKVFEFYAEQKIILTKKLEGKKVEMNLTSLLKYNFIPLYTLVMMEIEALSCLICWMSYEEPIEKHISIAKKQLIEDFILILRS